MVFLLKAGMLVSLFKSLVRLPWSFNHCYFYSISLRHRIIKLEGLHGISLKSRDKKRRESEVPAILGEKDKAEQTVLFWHIVAQKHMI